MIRIRLNLHCMKMCSTYLTLLCEEYFEIFSLFISMQKMTPKMALTPPPRNADLSKPKSLLS